jgi:hypothetical protein
MKKMLRVLTFLAVAALILMPFSAVSAKSPRINFTGSEWCDPASLHIMKEWMNGTDYHARGITQTCYDTADIPQMTGTDYLYLTNLDVINGEMKLSGAIRMVSDEGGTWLGLCNLPLGSDTITCVGRGIGRYKGLELHWFLTLDGPFSGYIIHRAGR